MCHPLRQDVPTNRFKVINDLPAKVTTNHNKWHYSFSRAARFRLNPEDSDVWSNTPKTRYQFLDSLMAEVPGMDNYPANIIDDGYIDGVAYPFLGDKTEPLNVGYYHRVFRSEFLDAMQSDMRRRGYNDQNVFMAATTNSQVVPMYATMCDDDNNCRTITERWTYAIPLEIIYLTPLSKWNPYDISYKGDHLSPEARTVTANGRDGLVERRRALNGTHSKKFFMTPHEFFHGEMDPNPADTTGQITRVLDSSGTMRLVRATGVRVILPFVRDVGWIRQRYPIMPIHADGNTISKEVEALKDLVFEELLPRDLWFQ